MQLFSADTPMNFAHENNHPQKLLKIGQIIFSVCTANRPKTSPNQNFCSIKLLTAWLMYNDFVLQHLLRMSQESLKVTSNSLQSWLCRINLFSEMFYNMVFDFFNCDSLAERNGIAIVAISM